ncbi:MAG: hypothetical protein BroJett015_05210 [Chloroflexota bacterium]|nr:hypothetical protein [Ardenticatenaceae bacterium]GIK54858.1 MAG: hypothetical protein BroJett015_05210 [Chloroflexota bacterium]
MYLLVMVLDDAARLSEVLAAWTAAGVPGITILESTGVNRVLTRQAPEVAFARFGQIFGGGRVGHNTIFSVIPQLEMADKVVAATEAVLGKLSEPHTGVMFILPVVRAWGNSLDAATAGGAV